LSRRWNLGKVNQKSSKGRLTMQIEIPSLLSIFAEVHDWRKARGLRYQLRSLLLLLVLGILCGKKGSRSLARWSKGLPAKTRLRVGLKKEHTPSATTFGRVLWHVVVNEVEAEIHTWVGAVHEQLVAAGVSKGVAIDGKTIRRAASLGARDVHLLSAVCHQLRVVLAQLAVDDKTNEITTIGPLLEKLLLKGVVVTVDALLTQRKVARQICQKGGHYIMYVKGNQPKMYWAIEQLFHNPHQPGMPAPVRAKSVNKGHGRVETREITLSTALNAFLDWPGLAQVFQLIRTTYHMKTGKTTKETVLGVTSFSPVEVTPTQLLTHIRNHWAASENGLHWVRDVVLGEDDSRLHKLTAPQTMAALRNLAINLARLAGFESITAAIDTFSADPAEALSLMGL
jgi:predicted transposase YbfD/YdcC